MAAEPQARRRRVRVRWSSPAHSDLAGINDHFRDVAPDFAFSVAAMAVRGGRTLGERPKLGPALGEGEYRKWRIGKTDYYLIYRIAGDHILISRVLHAAQDWGKFP